MKILVTGATGFVGKRLILTLLENGDEVYALCRIRGTRVFSEDKVNLHHLWGDLRYPSTIESIPKDIDAAYYLVHSMTEIVGNLLETELEVARQFIKGMKKTAAKQIIYLGGIINDEKRLSPHLKSRLEVENVLRESGIPTTILRASIIIGTGSASFEIIRDLCEKLPFMIAPKWVLTSCQPIAVRDVVMYLSKVLLNSSSYNKVYDVGGPDILTFKELLLEYAAFRHLKRYILTVPVLTPHLSSFWLVFITSVRFSLCRYLVESMKCPSIVKLKGIEEIVPHQCLSFTESLKVVFQNIEKNEVISTWMDSWEIQGVNPEISHYGNVPKEGCLKDQQKILINGTKESVIKRIWSLGGESGWYALNWAWRLRGFIDKLFGGVGLNRGRRNAEEIEVGDPIDFWRVILADKKEGHLILFSGMKVPGEAWLEFRLEQDQDKCFLIQTATFRPLGLLGRLYWYSLIPFHVFIFSKMAKKIAGY